MLIRKHILRTFLLLSIIFTSASVHAALIKSYDFNGNLSDTLLNGNDLVASGGTINAGRYEFTNNQGLQLSSALENINEYAIEIKFQTNTDSSGYSKLIDYDNLGLDEGLYIFNGGVTFFGNTTTTAGNIPLNTDVIVAISRSADVISVYLNNTFLFSASDDIGRAVPADNNLNFFEDDTFTIQRESFAGSVDYIRIYNEPTTFVPVPAAVWLFGSALLGLVGYSKRKSIT
ncbi:MAG: hypothetical protein AAGB35_04620 [Pseudomonadota bacterium]